MTAGTPTLEAAAQSPSAVRQGDVLWRPSEAAFTDSALARFAIGQGFDPHRYDELQAWSTSCRADFWASLWAFTGVIGERGERLEAHDAERGGRMLGTRFLPDARLNFAENLLRGDGERLAVIAADEDGVRERLDLAELRRRVAGAQHGLRALGVAPGDTVAGVLPSTVDNLVAYLATVSLGAVWAGCSPDFGAAGLIDRIGQVAPKVLIACETYRYSGRDFDIRANVSAVLDALPERPALVTAGTASWAEAFERADAPAEPVYERFAFDHPLLVMFTSGTTGLPKCIVHSTGGVLLQHLKEHVLHGDVRPGDVHSWFTSTAWMMYGWVVSVLAAEGAVLLIDGAPAPKRRDAAGDHVDHGHLWRIAEQAGVTHFGTSPRYLASLAEAGYHPGERHDLSALRSVLSAGAPVSVEQFGWVYDRIKRDQVFASIAGGTEIHGCFQLGSPLHPVRAGEITCIALGHAMAVLDARGAPVIGEQGDLVCTEPFPSIPLRFGGPDGLERLRRGYLAERPDVWTHGDLAEITPHRSVIIYGRTDTTLNPQGVRIGTAELYRVVEQDPAVADSIVFGLPTGEQLGADEEIVLCLVLADGCALDDALRARLRGAIRSQATPRHVPARIVAVPAVPYTINGKKVESAVRAIASGRPVSNRGSLANPEALDAYAELFGSGR